MGQYKDEIDVVAHNFNNSTLTFDNKHAATGSEMFQAERTNDELSVFEVGDGTAQFVESPSRIGEFTYQTLEAGPTNKYLWALRDERRSFPVSMVDASAPELDSSGKKCRIMKPPAIVRDKEAKTVEWKFLVTYLKMKGDGYRLEAE